MTKNQEDYLNMVLTVLAVAQENVTIWSKNVPFTNVINTITERADEITDYQAKQETDNTGITKDKKTLRTALENDIVMISHILSFFASDQKNYTLQKQMDMPPYILTRAPKLKLIGMGTVVLQEGTKYQQAAATYGLTEDLLTQLSKDSDAFSKILTAPREAITETSEATELIATTIAELHTLMDEKFDKAMMLYRGTNFYLQMQKARIIVDSPTHHLAMTARFTEANGNPVQNATVTIKDGEANVLRKSSPLGNIRVQNLKEGEHLMTVEKPGFEKQEILFVVASPETTKLTVVMK